MCQIYFKIRLTRPSQQLRQLQQIKRGNTNKTESRYLNTTQNCHAVFFYMANQMKFEIQILLN